MKIILIIVLQLSFLNFAAADLKCKQAVFEDEVSVRTSSNKVKSLELNGVGLATAFIVNVLYSALYLEEPSSNADQIMRSKKAKMVTVHALRNITEDQLINELDKEYERLCDKQCAKLQRYHDQLVSYTRDIKKNERMSLLFLSTGLEFISPTGEDFPPIRSAAYAKLMLQSAIGKQPANKRLKREMLGDTHSTCKEI